LLKKTTKNYSLSTQNEILVDNQLIS